MPTLYNLIPLSAAFRIVPYIALQPLPPYNSPVLSSHRHPKEPADLHAPKPIHTMVDHLRNTTNFKPDTRSSTRHRLHDCVGEVFLQGRSDKHIDSIIQGYDFRLVRQISHRMDRYREKASDIIFHLSENDKLHILFFHSP